MHPFDLRSAIFAKHAQHVVLIHFPIALFLTGVAFDLMSVWVHRKDLETVAFWNLTIAAVMVIPAALTGLAAWQLEFEGRALRGLLRLHLLLGLTSLTLILAVWAVHYRHWRRPDRSLSQYRWLIEGLGAAVLGATAHLGGFLSGVNH